MWHSTSCSLSSFTRNIAFGRGVTTVPSTSITSSFFATRNSRPGHGPERYYRDGPKGPQIQQRRTAPQTTESVPLLETSSPKRRSVGTAPLQLPNSVSRPVGNSQRNYPPNNSAAQRRPHRKTAREAQSRRTTERTSGDLFWLWESENERAVRSDADGVFPVSRQGPICGNDRPIVVKDSSIARSKVEHRFDCKRHALA